MIRCVLIGCGRISYKHVDAIKRNGINLVAICDILQEKMDELIDKMDLDIDRIKKYTDYKIMLTENPEIDFVSIATSSERHFDITQFCIKNKYSVLIEKPMTLSIKEANDIINEFKLLMEK